MNNCLFCKIINNEIPCNKLYENEKTMAFLDINPNSEGHVLIIPKKHFIDFQDCSEEYAIEVLKTKRMMAKRIMEKLHPKGLNYCSNQGSEAHQVIFHYHEHIVPKYEKGVGYMPHLNKNENDRPIEQIYELLK